MDSPLSLVVKKEDRSGGIDSGYAMSGLNNNDTHEHEGDEGVAERNSPMEDDLQAYDDEDNGSDLAFNPSNTGNTPNVNNNSRHNIIPIVNMAKRKAIEWTHVEETLTDEGDRRIFTCKLCGKIAMTCSTLKRANLSNLRRHKCDRLKADGSAEMPFARRLGTSGSIPTMVPGSVTDGSEPRGSPLAGLTNDNGLFQDDDEPEPFESSDYPPSPGADNMAPLAPASGQHMDDDDDGSEIAAPGAENDAAAAAALLPALMPLIKSQMPDLFKAATAANNNNNNIKANNKMLSQRPSPRKNSQPTNMASFNNTNRSYDQSSDHIITHSTPTARSRGGQPTMNGNSTNNNTAASRAFNNSITSGFMPNVSASLLAAISQGSENTGRTKELLLALMIHLQLATRVAQELSDIVGLELPPEVQSLTHQPSQKGSSPNSASPQQENYSSAHLPTQSAPARPRGNNQYTINRGNTNALGNKRRYPTATLNSIGGNNNSQSRKNSIPEKRQSNWSTFSSPTLQASFTKQLQQSLKNHSTSPSQVPAGLLKQKQPQSVNTNNASLNSINNNNDLPQDLTASKTRQLEQQQAIDEAGTDF